MKLSKEKSIKDTKVTVEKQKIFNIDHNEVRRKKRLREPKMHERNAYEWKRKRSVPERQKIPKY